MNSNNLSRPQQIGQLKIPKILFVPNDTVIKDKIPILSNPSSPIKGSSIQIDVQSKIKRIEQEREIQLSIKEQELEEKTKRCSFNRQAIIMNKINNVDQQFDKWKKIRNNIQFLNKAKLQYVCDYYENIMHRTQFNNQNLPNLMWSSQRKNKSYSDFETKKQEQLLKEQGAMKQRQRIQSVFNQQYKQSIEQIDNNLKVQRKKLRTKSKCFTLKKAFYNINDIKNHSHFIQYLT